MLPAAHYHNYVRTDPGVAIVTVIRFPHLISFPTTPHSLDPQQHSQVRLPVGH